MRKEYTLNSFIPDFFTSIDDFFSNFPTLYSLIDSQSDRRVYTNLEHNLDFIFYKYSSEIVAIVATTSYNSSEEIWYQKDTICSGYSKAKSDIREDAEVSAYVQNVAYYFPAPVLYSGNRLIANYNTEDNTFMFSIIRDINFSYTLGTHVVHKTCSLVFGNVSKYLDFIGGFFYGADNVHTFERYYRERHSTDKKTGITTVTYIGDGTYEFYDSSFTNIEFHIKPPPISGGSSWSYPWINDPYGDIGCCFGGNMSNPDNINNFEAVLRADIDNAPNRKKDSLVSTTTDIDITKFNIPKVRRNNIWAVTMNIEYYVRMVCSISKSSTLLPRYKPLLCNSSVHEGHTTNTLNNISIIMPLWFMVQRDPSVLDNYSAACYNNIINFVNMFNMDTNRIKNGIYPTRNNHIYDCFQMGNRRAMFGMLGYSGLAFQLDE